MNAKTIVFLLDKEYKILFRNTIFLLFSVVLLVLLIGLYYILPSYISQEEPSIAVYSEVDSSVFFQTWDVSAEAMKYKEMSSREEMMDAVRSGDQSAGFVITEQLWKDLTDCKQAEVILYTKPGLVDEYVQSITFILDIVFSEISYSSNASSLRIITEELFIGEDIFQNKVSFKTQMIPLMISLLLIMEVFSLGISLVEEIESRSIKAVLSAPVSIGEVLFAKSFAGISVIFIQILIFLIAIGATTMQFPALLSVILAGAVLTTGLSALLAAYSNDMMSLVSKGVFVMIIMVFPLFGILFPGMMSSWMRFFPTYMLAQSLNLLINQRAIWVDSIFQICSLSAISIIIFNVGITCMRRKVLCQ